MMSCRFTERAKALSFIFFFTDAASTSNTLRCGFTYEMAVLERGFALHIQVVGVGENGAADLLVDAALRQNRLAFLRMLFERGMDLPVEIVQQSGDGPLVFVFA